MGQKINPLGLRLGTTQSHHSLWFAKPKNYSKELREDAEIRHYIKNYVQKNMTKSVMSLLRIEIEKSVDLTATKIYIVPTTEKAFKDYYLQESENLQPNLEKKFASLNKKCDFKTRQKIDMTPKLNFTLIKISEPYRHPRILAEFISAQLLERIPFRKAMKKAIELARQAKTNGIRVQLAGRLGGNDIARVEWMRKGRVPLQTIQAKIDYCSYPIRTAYGILGIKIWIFIDGE